MKYVKEYNIATGDVNIFRLSEDNHIENYYSNAGWTPIVDAIFNEESYKQPAFAFWKFKYLSEKEAFIEIMSII